MRVVMATAAGLALAGSAWAGGRMAAAEATYADWLDAAYAVSTLSSGAMPRIDGQGLPIWRSRLTTLTAEVKTRLVRVDGERLNANDARALVRMRSVFADPPSAPAAATEGDSAANCEKARVDGLDRASLSAALYGCFERYGNHIAFQGRTITRATALELLQRLDDPGQRAVLFEALEPLWRRVNGDGWPASPYRRLIRLSAAEYRAKGSSPIDDAARTLGVSSAEAEGWLVAVLDRWRAANPGPMIEPWDYWSRYAAAVRPLDALIPAGRITPLSFAYYRDLGLDLAGAGTVHDLAVRPGKAPLAYADFIRIGRQTPTGWRPARARVSGNVETGGLFALNEIVHEDGHVAHMLAVRARPAFFDLGDDLFVEAFADVTSWAVAEPAWQSRYLGRSIPGEAGRRALLANVMLDVAWGLFELRMLRDPAADSNRVWTDITSRYLNIRPHPELSWWALRVQLVDTPGYMINYGLGAILTADLRQRLAAEIGAFDAGNPAWDSYLGEHLLRFGASVSTPLLLRRFLGRRVTAQALLQEIGALEPVEAHPSAADHPAADHR